LLDRVKDGKLFSKENNVLAMEESDTHFDKEGS